MDSKKIIITLIALIVYIVTTGISYSIFAKNSPSSPSSDSFNGSVPKKTNDFEAVVFDDTLPKTEECPLTGVKYSKEQAKWWGKHRPLGVMIENHQEARPQSGILFADVVYEAVAEGGITRYLAVFHCQDGGIIGPVRSARTYFMDFVSEYGEFPLYVHVGGANCNRETGSGCQNGAKADAIGQIVKYGWDLYGDMNYLRGMGYPEFRRDESRLGRDVATEHTVYSSTSRLWLYVAKERGLTNVDKDGNSWDKDYKPYSFKDDPKLDARAAAQNVHLEFWEAYSQYDVDWVYDRQQNEYKRKNGGANHMDRNTNKQITAKNIVVVHMTETPANDGYDNNVRRLYKTIGSGRADFFIDGKRIKGKWVKDERTARTELFDSLGKEIEFTRGNIWFEILPQVGTLDVT